MAQNPCFDKNLQTHRNSGIVIKKNQSVIRVLNLCNMFQYDQKLRSYQYLMNFSSFLLVCKLVKSSVVWSNDTSYFEHF